MSGTYTQNFFNMMAHWLMTYQEAPGTLNTVAKTDGTSMSLSQLRGTSTSYDTEYRPQAKAPVGDTTYGILAGTGTTAALPADHTLESLIAHGDTDGSLNYDEVKCDGFEKSANGSWELKISRFFSNNGSIAVTINEIGVVMKMPTSYNSWGYSMIYREVLDTPITIQPGGSIRYRTTINLNTGFA